METASIFGFIFSLILGAAFGLFYSLLLAAHGFKVKYKYVASGIGLTIFLLGLIRPEASAVGAAVFGIGIFILAIGLFMREEGKAFGEMGANIKKLESNDGSTASFNPFKYYGVFFHLAIAVLIVLSVYTYSKDVLLSEERMSGLIRDVIFQFYSTLLFIILGIFNPFAGSSTKLIALGGLINEKEFPKFKALVSNPATWRGLKALICIGVITMFYLNGYLRLPAWGASGIYMNAAIFLIGLFIVGNAVYIIRNPDLFFKKNILRVTMLFRSAFMSLFLSAILVIMTMFGSAIAGIDLDKLHVSSEGILFLGFNLVMAFNEYKIARS